MTAKRLYGELALAEESGTWRLKAEPHVLIRVKRLFPRVAAERVGTVTIKDSDEVRRDLFWILDRYPLTISPRDWARLAEGSRLYDERSRVFDGILTGKLEPRDFELALPPREYQKVAADLALRMGGLLVADDLGLGKTITAICMLTDKRTRPALVVTLTHLPRQWDREIKKFAPALRTHIIKKGSPYDVRDKAGKFPDVLIVNYHKLNGWAQSLGGVMKAVVFDEAQELRRDASAKYDAAQHIAAGAKYRMGLSVGPESTIELRGGPFGAGWVGRIDEAHGQAASLMDTRDGMVDVEALGIQSRGWTGAGFGWKQVRKFIAHPCDRPVRRLFVGGDRLVVTDDHSVFRAKDGLECVRSDEIGAGDVLPVDDGGSWNEPEERLVEVWRLSEIQSPKTYVTVDLSGQSRQDFGLTPQQWQKHKHGKFGERLPLSLYLAHQNKLPPPSSVYLGRVKRTNRIEARVRLSDWAYIMGFFLGDGWLSDDRVCFAVEDARVHDMRERLRALPGLQFEPTVRQMRGKSVELRCGHRFMAAVLRHAMGKRKSYEKTIPGEWIVTWPREARLELLRGLIDSDGHVSARSGRVYFTTTSPALARTLLSLLRSVGVVGGLHARAPALGGFVRGRQIRAVRASYVVNWSAYAMKGDNEGHRGTRRRLDWSKDRFLEGVVRSIEPDVAKPETVFDLEMDGHPSFVANGVLVHNSATPIYGYGSEFYNVLSVIQPDSLGSKSEFVREWCRGVLDQNGRGRIDDPKAFGAFVRDAGLMIRRTRRDAGRELPRLSKISHYVDSDTKALDEAKSGVMALAKMIVARSGTSFDRMKAGGELDWKMRQATGIAKSPYVAEFVKMLVESGEKVLLYGWHHAVYRVWMERFAEDTRAVLYTGEESVAQKDQALRSFIEGDTQVLIMSLRAGQGIDGIQKACRTVVFGELDWSPGVLEQCVGRVYRDGQTDPVAAYFLIADEGSDPVIADVLGLKKAQIEGVRDPEAELTEQVGAAPEDGIRRLAESVLAARQKEGDDDEDDAGPGIAGRL